MKIASGVRRFFMILVHGLTTVLAISVAHAADYSSAVPADGPLAYYRFKDSQA
jgi:hypothetical protein